MDIIILILLSIRIRNIVRSKGYNATPWVVKTVIAWFVFEMIGIAFSYLFQRDFIVLALSGLLAALGSYAYFYHKAVNLPVNKEAGSDDQNDHFLS